ncbi:Nicotinamide-nucleotide amidohydrolase PncC [Vibrio stylophorae]|uniref:Nicotinamide-nucleotide amidohydrolase PncC n=1 Tax=Vibrio stylophorae TaxID=659351 RepID=A0ABM8ZVJ8_9VIBR|nr:nicotinamide-nucleotide amidohydrolase family protein [Vibrio stylophorae]CAH0534344.1 Nicotinamide-nucleotide amidohydrolase PncC [Vibrio stylophorae]
MNHQGQQLAQLLLAKQWQMATAESCTGGGVAMALTDIAGSSAWFDRAFVTYSNEAKTQMLGVSEALISRHGAVSDAVVRAMAQGAITHSNAKLTVSISGIAGPGGGSDEKPVGTVWFAWADHAGWVKSQCQHFTGDRQAVRQQAVAYAIAGCCERLTELS